MPCIPVNLPSGNAIICTGRQRKHKCVACGKSAKFLCDWKLDGTGDNTCDKPICSRCTTNPVHHGRICFDKDLCPEHAARWKARNG